MSKNNAQVWFWITVIYTLTTFGLSSMTSLPVRWVNKYRIDWWIHGFQYGILALLMMKYFAARGTTTPIFASITTFIFCGVVGGLNEMLQKYVPRRYPSISDEVANLAGALFFISLYHIIRLSGRKGDNR